ncbi:retinol dehydrogenase 12-like [Leguminivora glycinivorella]|uniref:retinol dehydrogenase 12-like n=1 Tax=Leguminivora glycinivorella TaxID=1035111 RepID=UPI00200D4807|nr:retinol dehydrogenase 12-like [Leguminivora glycinivorella]
MGGELFVVFVLVIIFVTKLSVLISKTSCKSKVPMRGKVIIVTGANSGLGFETAKDLAKRGGRVIMACRNEHRALAARDLIIAETGNSGVVYKHLDMSSLASVRRFVEDVTSTEKRLDVLINNAGVNGCGDRFTEDGIVEEMQVNYFGIFLLTLLLVPLLKKTGESRIVNVSSTLHFFGRINFEHINKKGYYLDMFTYSNSKLCTVLFTVELARKLKGSGVTVNAVHPGIIMTNITAASCALERLLFSSLCWISSRNVVEGAQTIIYLAVAKEVATTTGKYFIDCKESYMTRKTKNKKLITDLWNYSEKLVGYEELKDQVTCQT